MKVAGVTKRFISPPCIGLIIRVFGTRTISFLIFSGAERRTRIVIGITAIMMVLEITVGLISNSMALLADGWHMSTHVIAFLINAVAYYLARKYSSNARFTFGTGKIGVLGGFSSAVVLAIIALLMAGESAHVLQPFGNGLGRVGV